MNKKDILAILSKRANKLDSEGKHIEADVLTRKMVKVSGFGNDQHELDKWLRTDRDPELMRHTRRHDPLADYLDPIGNEGQDDGYYQANGEKSPRGFGDPDMFNEDMAGDVDLGYDDEADDPNLDMDTDPYDTKKQDWMMASNRQNIKKAKQQALKKLARFANKLDSQGRFAEADLITNRIIKLASNSCMECGHDGSRSPVSKYILQINGNKSNETLCEKCLKKAKNGGYKVVSVLGQVAAPSPEDLKAREQLNELTRQYRQEKGDYWNPGASVLPERNILAPNWNGDIDDDAEYRKRNDPRYLSSHQS